MGIKSFFFGGGGGGEGGGGFLPSVQPPSVAEHAEHGNGEEFRVQGLGFPPSRSKNFKISSVSLL